MGQKTPCKRSSLKISILRLKRKSTAGDDEGMMEENSKCRT